MNISFHHVCIDTPCYGESLHFYQNLMGFDILHETKDFHGRKYNTWLQNGNIIIELQTPKEDAREEPGTGNRGITHVCFQVDDLDAAVAELEKKGFTDFVPGKKTYQVMDCRLSKLKAPEGTVIELR